MRNDSAAISWKNQPVNHFMGFWRSTGRQSLSRDELTNDIVANITITNTGGGAASNVQLTSLLLGGAATTTPLPNLGNISAGASASTAVRFPGSAGSPGAASVLRVAGSRSGGNFAANFRVILP
jgi:hypothetical protein